MPASTPVPMWATACRALAATALLAATSLPALADTPISFAQSGRIDITFVANQGGFDHIIQPVIVGGNGQWNAAVPEGLAWIVGTEGGSLLNLIGDPNAPRSPTAFNYVWGYFDDVPAGTEITVRLTNVHTDRIGGTDPDSLGAIHSQLFSGSSSINNVEFSGGSVAGGTPGAPNFGAPLPGGYSQVTMLSPTQIQLGFSDLFLDPNGSFDNVVLLFTLTPVPEPGTLAYLLAGLAVMAGVARRMR